MNRSVLIALGIFLALCLYMLTGLVGCGQSDAETAVQEAPARKVMTVQVREMRAREIPREVVLSGMTQPSRSVDLRAETAGRIIRVADQRGKAVRKGDVIAEIEMNDREERLEQARAALEQARFEFEAVQRLREEGLRSDAQVAQARAVLRGAEQAVRAMEVDIRNTRLTAPFNGILQERMVEEGDYVGLGDPVARLIDLDPLVVEGEATEFEIDYLEIGEIGHARLREGLTLDGLLRYVAGEADPMTRTFTVELEVDNPGSKVPAGLTAQLAVETERVPAYEISPALISISDEGTFGVKIVDESNTVRFYEADIVKTAPESIWLTGLPESIRLITVGQGFTQPGDTVKVELDSGDWAS